MKNQPVQWMTAILLVSFLFSCNTTGDDLPELTYSGETPRVQDPLSPEDSQKHIQLPEGFEASLFAAEPDIINPIAMAWDERGRLWVVQSMDYPHELNNEVGGDRITICEDTNGDGRADQFTDFATKQSLTTGMVIVKGGIIVAQAPEIVFLADEDGDDQMDARTVLFDGFGTWDTHAGPANLKYGPDNMIWGSVGYSGFENQFQGKDVNFKMGVFRFSRDGQSFEPVGQFNNNTWGLGLTADLEIFGSTANNNHACYVGIPLKHYSYLEKRPSWAINADFIQGHYELTVATKVPIQQVDVRGGYTAAAGANFYTAMNYPEEYRGQMYVNEPTGHIVHLAKIVEDGAGYQEEDGGNIFASTDGWTAPVHSETGPDGNLWVADWYNPVIQHNPDKRGMENQIWNAEKGEGNAHLNSLRDKRHGRIYIIKHRDGQVSPIQSLDPNDHSSLLAALQSDNMFWRTTAQRLIVEHQITELAPQLRQLVVEKQESAAYGVVHAMWALEGLGALEEEKQRELLVSQALKHTHPAVQKTALALLPVSTLGSELLVGSGLLTSSNLHVRLAALLRASELPETKALFEAIEQMTTDPANQEDKWLNAALKIYFKTPNTESIEPSSVDMIIPSAEEAPTTWRYTVVEPEGDWFEMAYQDDGWSEAEAPFGGLKVGDHIKTEWKADDIWLRKTVNLDDVVAEPVLKILHDDHYEVYINGKLLNAEKGASGSYKYIRLDKQLGSLFTEGKNTIAVHCQNGGGRQFIDVGIGKVGTLKADVTLTLNTIPQKMAYDQTELSVTAGQYVELVLNNVDEMPHNLVLIEAGSLETFGVLVDEFLKSPNAANSEYVPSSRYVLGATKMLDPGETGTIFFKAPDKPGEYPFICTFPGHWRMMQGILTVTKPGTYLAKKENAIRVASMGGGGSHEFLRFFGIDDGRVLSQNGEVEVRYTESSNELWSWLPDSDVLYISNNKPFNEKTKASIFQRVDQGMSMLIYHPSTWYNWKDWPEFNRELVGGGSKSHEKLQEFEVEVIKPNHPIMKGVPQSFRIIDELYRWEQDPEGTEIEVLAIARGIESRAEYPAVWIVKHPKAKIICNTLGHDDDAHSLPAYQTLLRNSLNWVKPDRPEAL